MATTAATVALSPHWIAAVAAAVCVESRENGIFISMKCLCVCNMEFDFDSGQKSHFLIG